MRCLFRKLELVLTMAKGLRAVHVQRALELKRALTQAGSCAVSYSGQIGLNSVNTHPQAFVMPHQIAQVKTSATLNILHVRFMHDALQIIPLP